MVVVGLLVATAFRLAGVLVKLARHVPATPAGMRIATAAMPTKKQRCRFEPPALRASPSHRIALAIPLALRFSQTRHQCWRCC